MNTTKSKSESLTLITGGTGKTGRRLLQKLDSQGYQTRSGSRSAETPFDWQNSQTWDAALKNVRNIYLAYYPDLCVPGAVETIRDFVKFSVDAGVQKIVILSGRGEKLAQVCEKIVQDSGVVWTILRASWFAQNFSEGFMLDMIVSGMVPLPTGGTPEPFIDVNDIVDAAFVSLTTGHNDNQAFELTGPRLLTFDNAISEISAALNRDIKYVDTPHNDFLSGMNAHGVPEEYVTLLDYLFKEVLDGRNATVKNGVQQATGMPARDFLDYAKAAAASGAWSSFRRTQ